MMGKGTASALKPALSERSNRRVPYGPRNAALAAEHCRVNLQKYFSRQASTYQTPKDRTDKDFSGKDQANSRDRKHSEHRLEQVLRATDLLLESGGFGLIILDLADVPHQSARRIPLTTWFRFRSAVEHKPTILLAIEQQPIAGSCSSLLLQLGSQEILENTRNSQLSDSSRKAAGWESPARQCRVDVARSLDSTTIDDRSTSTIISPSHANLLTELKIYTELIRSRPDRKPARSVAFETKTAWAG